MNDPYSVVAMYAGYIRALSEQRAADFIADAADQLALACATMASPGSTYHVASKNTWLSFCRLAKLDCEGLFMQRLLFYIRKTALHYDIAEALRAYREESTFAQLNVTARYYAVSAVGYVVPGEGLYNFDLKQYAFESWIAFLVAAQLGREHDALFPLAWEQAAKNRTFKLN